LKKAALDFNGLQTYAGWIASEGQASAQLPQSVQTSGSIT
jgi:hypothetical protein